MAEAGGDKHSEGGGGGLGAFVPLLLIFIVFVALWFAKGNATNANFFRTLITNSPVLSLTGTSSSAYSFMPAAPTIGGPTAGNASIPPSAASGGSNTSGTVDFSDHAGVYTTSPAQEYITLHARANNSGAIDITGWKLRSGTTGKVAVIGSGVLVPMLGQPNALRPIMLYPGDTAIIATGRSPIGASFLENECSGYLQQFQSFYPSLTNSCPAPASDFSSNAGALTSDQSCTQAVGQISSCRALTAAPQGVSSACAAYLTAHFTYNGCAALHQYDTNFKGRQWRVFLGETTKLWGSQSDTIVLSDAQGNPVASISY